jgi:CheY-like chemotaxis protein
MGGRLRVESVPGQGSTFWFEVSLPVTQAPAPVRPVPRRQIVGYEGARQKVLVADDQEDNRRLLVDVLQPLGFDVRTAEDGQRAVEVAREWEPDLILMDLVMPVKNGLEATAELRRDPARGGVVIIAVSASVLEADQENSQSAGCDAFLHKPIEIVRLVDLLETHLHLTWVHGEPQEPRHDIPVEVVAPPRAELMRLHQLALAGRIVDLQARASHLAGQDDAYLPFVARLRELARGFELDQIATFVERFIHDGQDE